MNIGQTLDNDTLVLHPGNISTAEKWISDNDPVMARIISASGGYNFNSYSPDGAFASLCFFIIHQLLTPRAALKIYSRLVDLLGGSLSELTLLSYNREEIRSCGISCRKVDAMFELARRSLGQKQSIFMSRLSTNSEIIADLMSVKGIGPWTAHMYLIFNLRRADIFPEGDAALRKGLKGIYGSYSIDEITSRWAPYRSLGSLHVWKWLDS